MMLWIIDILLITLVCARSSIDDIVAEFTNPNGDEMAFEKMVVDPSTGRLYIGGVNNLYELHQQNLNVKSRISTGPEDDSVECPTRNCTMKRAQKNSYTKALAVYEKMSKLIECTSLYQGRCRLRNLYNIAETNPRESIQHIVANDRESSTVAFAGHGSSNSDSTSSTNDVLYVASTYVQNGGPYRDDVPAVAALSLDNARLFEVAVQGVGTGTEIKLERKYRGQYKIDYVGGFESGRFAYFATRQPKGDTVPTQSQWPIISKLVRVCTGDKHFWSYTEVPIECQRDGVDYNLVKDVYIGKPGYDLADSLGVTTDDDVLYAVFVRGGGHEQNAPTRESALCIYSMKQIESKFLDNIELCFRGEVYKNLPWFKSTDRCLNTKFSGQEVVCGKDVNSYIGGEIAIEAKAAMTTKDAQFTSIAVNTTHSATVAFVGTLDGRLLKCVIERADHAFVYRTLEVGAGRPLLPDMELDGNGEFLYTLTENSVTKIRVRQCGDLNVCTQCLQQRDPYCGWCVLDNRCSPENDCRKSIPPSAHGLDWLSYKTGQCTTIRSVEPDRIQITGASFIIIQLDNLPTLAEPLTCEFHFAAQPPLKMAAEPPKIGDDNERRLRCPTPITSRLPTIPIGEHSIVARLSISQGGPPLASINFTFYDCGRYVSCSSCVSSEFPCDFCVESNQCVSGTSTENRCREQRIINGVARTGPSSRKGPSYCPHIVSADRDFYVASGENREITVETKNILDFMTDFKCQFKIDHSVHERAARRVDEQITCDDMKFEYYGVGLGNGTAIAHLSIVWWSTASRNTAGHMLDNSQGIRVIIYKCASLALNCGLCLSLDANRFNCGWCSSDQSCTRQDKCTSTTVAVASAPSTSLFNSRSDRGWLDRSQLCPSPKIIDFNPKKGPITGGTRLTIDGINLGRDYVDVVNAVSTANVRCELLPDEYVTSTRIVCITKPSVHVKPASNPIVVKLRDDIIYTAISEQNFEYVDPSITGFQPRRGPMSGGTHVTIGGQNLDAGSTTSATLAGYPCTILRRSNVEIVCQTSGANSDKDGHLQVIFDGAKKEFAHLQFRYEKDPKVTSVRPERSIVSGGIQVEVRGTGFDLIQRPHMVVVEDDRSLIGPKCRIDSSELMFCRTPDLKIPPTRRNQPTNEHPLMLDYGFEMDGVRSGNISQQPTFNRLSVFPDPIIERFSDVRFYRIDDYLTINGRYIDAAAAEHDVSVTVGSESCNLTALANRALTCQPPPIRPAPQLAQNSNPEVTVTIGGKIYDVGYLSYDSSHSPLSFEVLVAIAAAVLIFIIAFILLLLAYRRKTTRHSRQMKHLKMQMDTIEMKVAAECKEAFAELQTSMSAMAADLPVGTPMIPFLSYRDYAAQVLFPNSVNHPVMRELEVDSSRAPQIEKALRTFNQLLMNKTFLLTFVRIMEANKYFLSKDRVYVGSLLMVVLQEKMEYCTEILKTLLEDLIERTVERRYQPKILFRRSESVAERMLAAWFTFLMHRYLAECAGQPLYMLYWAIKQQVEKGPQDAITLEARYSLSEEKLLRSSFDFKEVTVYVAADSGYSTDYPVRVLDCDTISQVKEKCLDAKYRMTAFSERPLPHDLDVELRPGVNGRLLLQDLDATTKTEIGGWKKLNTLAHYKVPNDALLALLPRQASLYNLSLLSERSDKSTFSLKNSPTLSRTFGNSAHHHHSKDPESGYKLYHLVKPTEHGPNDQQDKMVSEIYLTRLLTMKGTLQKFIEDLLEAIFSTTMRTSSLPLCVKYMFDFMDEQALDHNITDPEVVHAWKSNALPLRFWVNLIKNPHFVFDIPKPTKIEGCLSVVAQTLMDACSTQDHQLTKDSPSSKLLFAKDIYQYRDWVDKYYAEIKNMPAVSDQDMNAFLADESRSHTRQFHLFSALNELYKYLDQYKEQLSQALEEDEFARKARLPAKFAQMISLMDGDSSTPVIGGYAREEHV